MLPVCGKVLWVDLTSREIHAENVSASLYEQFLDGLGLGVALLLPRIPAGADALGPENVLGFLSGFLTGSGSLMTGRWMAVCKSPLTGGWGDANCGGTFSPAVRSTINTFPMTGSIGFSSPSREGEQETDLVAVLQNRAPGRALRVDAPEEAQAQVER